MERGSDFRSMDCDVVVSDPGAAEIVRALFDERDRRFSRFLPSSELQHVNASPLGLTFLSEEFASMLALALDAARATDGLVTPAVGGAVIAAGYDRDVAVLPLDGDAVEPAPVPPLAALSLRGHVLLRSEPVLLDLNGVVKGATLDDALALVGPGWVSAGGDVATSVPVVVELPGGEAVTLGSGGLATSRVARRTRRRGGDVQHHLIDPATGVPARSPWREVTVCARSCLVADVAAKAALLAGRRGPAWLDKRALPGRFLGADGRIVRNRAWRAALAETPLAA